MYLSRKTIVTYVDSAECTNCRMKLKDRERQQIPRAIIGSVMPAEPKVVPELLDYPTYL